MIKVLEEEYYFYTFEHDDEADEYFLEVVCGTVAIFLIKIKLNAAELAKYRADPASIRTIAYDILDHPHSYNERAIR